MFYNSFAKSVTCYGLSVYGTAAKTNFKKTKLPEEEFQGNFFFLRNWIHANNLVEKKIAVFELYIIEIKSFQTATPRGTNTIFDVFEKDPSQYPTRWSSIRLLPS